MASVQGVSSTERSKLRLQPHAVAWSMDARMTSQMDKADADTAVYTWHPELLPLHRYAADGMSYEALAAIRHGTNGEGMSPEEAIITARAHSRRPFTKGEIETYREGYKRAFHAARLNRSVADLRFYSLPSLPKEPGYENSPNLSVEGIPSKLRSKVDATRDRALNTVTSSTVPTGESLLYIGKLQLSELLTRMDVLQGGASANEWRDMAQQLSVAMFEALKCHQNTLMQLCSTVREIVTIPVTRTPTMAATLVTPAFAADAKHSAALATALSGSNPGAKRKAQDDDKDEKDATSPSSPRQVRTKRGQHKSGQQKRQQQHQQSQPQQQQQQQQQKQQQQQQQQKQQQGGKHTPPASDKRPPGKQPQRDLPAGQAPAAGATPKHKPNPTPRKTRGKGKGKGKG